VDVTGKEVRILREGAISRESLSDFLKKNP
jgi:tRNA A37 threonylcarbamoyladenosine synthetase subunit TsaC/SUA5/YrdC